MTASRPSPHLKGNVKRKIAVIGTGAGGLAMAGHLALKGFSVRLLYRREEGLEAIIERGGVELHGALNGFGKIELISPDISKVLQDAEILFVVVPGHAHPDVARRCAPHLTSDQLVVLCPGRTFGAVSFKADLEAHGQRDNIVIAEAQTIPHTCRRTSDGRVSILSLKAMVQVAAYPVSETTQVLASVSECMDSFVGAQDTLETGLNNIGCIFHPLPTLLNIGWIETERTNFKHYYEGITPTVAAMVEQLDAERMAIGQCLGAQVFSARQWLADTYGSHGDSLYSALQATTCYGNVDAPRSIEHRYLYEDVPTGLVPLAALGAHLGVPTPTIDTTIDLANAACQTDFRATGRNLQQLRLTGKTPEELRQLVTKR